MNFIHISDLRVFKSESLFPESINLDKVLRIYAWSNSNYFRLYFRMTDGNDTTWEFKNLEDLKTYSERVMSLIDSKDVSQMTKLQ